MINKFKPQFDSSNLIRLGPNSDSGYLIPKSLLKSKSTLIVSFGVGFTIDFELDFLKKCSETSIFLYDYSCSFKSVIREILLNFKKAKFIKSLKLLLRYLKLSLQIFYYREKISLFDKFISDNKNLNNILLHDAFTDIDFNSYDYKILKIDIERSEYLILKDHHDFKLLQERFDIIIIEFHGLLTNHNKIDYINEQFKKNGFFIGHYHNNNCVAFVEDFKMNNCFEVLYLSKIKFEEVYRCNNGIYPIPNLDFSCCPEKNENEFYF
jgi:hypothetical protein